MARYSGTMMNDDVYFLWSVGGCVIEDGDVGK